MQGLGVIYVRQSHSVNFIFKIPFFVLGALFLWMILAEAYANQSEEEPYARYLTTDSMAVVLSADDIKKGHAEDENIRVEDSLRVEESAVNDAKTEKGQERAKEAENPAAESSLSENNFLENNAAGNIQSTEKALEIRRQTQSIGTATAPTIDGGLISAPELVDALEAGYRLEDGGDVMDISSVEALFILSKLNSFFEEDFFYNAAKLLYSLRKMGILYRDNLSQNAKLIATAWFDEVSKAVYGRNKIAKRNPAAHSKLPKANNHSKSNRGGAHG